MKRFFLMFFLGGLVFTAFSGLTLMAQNAVVNPNFETGDFLGWDNLDPSLKIIPGNTALGMDGYCARKYPGEGANNNSMVEEIFLLEGVTYEFSANIAAQYCST